MIFLDNPQLKGTCLRHLEVLTSEIFLPHHKTSSLQVDRATECTRPLTNKDALEAKISTTSQGRNIPTTRGCVLVAVASPVSVMKQVAV